MEITSSAFKDQGKIPIQYVMPGAGGKNIFTADLEEYTCWDKILCLIDCGSPSSSPKLGSLAGDQYS